ncbi:hypothetical protein LIPSTDRAFT_117918 [Lipomyces starkeyi NRRL Y-11557]|uniref:HAT C-terminal dimerisation domain-containing protein n=1 Tax=Lipomyces starkeyi NRRL Y-11557 TaxID=675824 RepID=A0A1E3Q3W5_LIPST|nr:hypothetical protein LIPSTDRAFT_117918 [Lipomyces starkeyi NRRL Y-11557]
MMKGTAISDDVEVVDGTNSLGSFSREQHPRIARMARDFLAISVRSCPSESVFSIRKSH